MTAGAETLCEVAKVGEGSAELCFEGEKKKSTCRGGTGELVDGMAGAEASEEAGEGVGCICSRAKAEGGELSQKRSGEVGVVFKEETGKEVCEAWDVKAGVGGSEGETEEGGDGDEGSDEGGKLVCEEESDVVEGIWTVGLAEGDGETGAGDELGLSAPTEVAESLGLGEEGDDPWG